MQKYRQTLQEWLPAIRLALLIAFLQRIFFQVWMGSVYALVKNFQPDTGYHYSPEAERLPVLKSDLSKVLFEIWRRWDAVQYLNLAQNWYQTDDPKPTIFPPLTPAGIRFVDVITPGIVDAGGLLFATLCFILFLTLFHRFCETYYRDKRLATASVMVVAFLPSAYVWNAPMSEAPFMALTMAFLCLILHNYRIAALIIGILATLTRQQGMVLGGITLLIVLEQEDARYGIRADNWLNILKRVWFFALLPLAWIAFLKYRTALGLLSYTETQEVYYGTYFTDPVTGLLETLRLFIEAPDRAFLYPDLLAVLFCLVLTPFLFFFPHHRRLPMLAYTIGYLATFFILGLELADGTKLKVSFLRQSMTLFPLWVFIADRLIHSAKWIRLAYVALLFALILILSAAHSAGGGVS